MALSAASIPEMVSRTILETLKPSLVYARLFNQDYQGDAAYGNTVRIPNIGAVVTEPYVRYEDITGQEASDDGTDMLIDKAQAFAITLDDLDAVQASPNILASYLVDAVFELKKDLEKDLAAELASAGTLVTGFGTALAPIEVNSSNICTQLRAMAMAMDNALVPRSSRAIVLPPWAVEKLTLASIVDATDNTSQMAEGMVGRYAGFDILMSPLVENTAGAKYRILAGSPRSATYAIQIEKVETIRHPKQFADILRGLCSYGAKTTRPGTVVNAYWNLAAEAE